MAEDVASTLELVLSLGVVVRFFLFSLFLLLLGGVYSLFSSIGCWGWNTGRPGAVF